MRIRRALHAQMCAFHAAFVLVSAIQQRRWRECLAGVGGGRRIKRRVGGCDPRGRLLLCTFSDNRLWFDEPDALERVEVEKRVIPCDDCFGFR
jgi:hypothetical protein